MKKTREIATEYRMTQWTEVMRERQSSGLSIIGYCRREGIKPDRYFYWQRKLRAAAINAASVNLELLPPTTETVAAVPTGWTQVRAAQETNVSKVWKNEDNSKLTIEIGKCRVSVSTATDTELLEKVCKMLVTLC